MRKFFTADSRLPIQNGVSTKNVVKSGGMGFPVEAAGYTFEVYRN
jgi:hypothetical protein